MRVLLKSIFLLCLPFLIMITVNESMKGTQNGINHNIYGVPTMNSGEYDISKCTWACHNATTNHCKIYHASSISPYFKWIDPIYFGMIGGLHKTGNYRLANVILLSLIWPLFMSYLFFRVLKMRKELHYG